MSRTYQLQNTGQQVQEVISRVLAMPQYVLCTLSEYEAMEFHDSNTYYIIIADPE